MKRTWDFLKRNAFTGIFYSILCILALILWVIFHSPREHGGGH